MTLTPAVRLDTVGGVHRVTAVDVDGDARQTTVTVPLAQASLGDTAVSHGRAQIEQTSIQFAAAQREGGEARFRAVLEHGGTRVPLEIAFAAPAPAAADA